jgi:hypothetical protein
LFALGGSGIRAVEPLVHLCGFGLGPRRLKLCLIDPDQSNEAVGRIRRLVDRYQAVRAELGASVTTSVYFRTEIIETSGGAAVWSPIADDERLPDARFKSRVDRAKMSNPHSERLGQLFDLLYSKKFQEMDLGLGFRGVPAIGTVFMNRLRDEPFFSKLLNDATTEKESVFFSIGSIFGGTGAAAFPVVGRALVDGFKDEIDRPAVPGVSKSRIGGALLLPYFTLPTSPDARAPDGGIRADTALFAQNAAAAIPAYTSGQTDFSELYVLGDSQPREQKANAVGGERQANPPHYVEFFAAIAALDFARRDPAQRRIDTPTFRIATVEDRNLGWNDLPLDSPSRHRLMGGIVAAHTVLTLFRGDNGTLPDLDRRFRGMTWLDCLGLRADELERSAGTLDALGAFFAATWNWLVEMRVSTPALEIIQYGHRPSEVRLDEIIAGRRPSGRRQRLKHEYDVFRHWDLSAYQRKERGFAGFAEVMREGSERFVSERFAEPSNWASR